MMIRALIRLEARILTCHRLIATSIGNRLGFVSGGKVSVDFGVVSLIAVKCGGESGFFPSASASALYEMEWGRLKAHCGGNERGS